MKELKPGIGTGDAFTTLVDSNVEVMIEGKIVEMAVTVVQSVDMVVERIMSWARKRVNMNVNLKRRRKEQKGKNASGCIVFCMHATNRPPAIKRVAIVNEALAENVRARVFAGNRHINNMHLPYAVSQT